MDDCQLSSVVHPSHDLIETVENLILNQVVRAPSARQNWEVLHDHDSHLRHLEREIGLCRCQVAPADGASHVLDPRLDTASVGGNNGRICRMGGQVLANLELHPVDLREEPGHRRMIVHWIGFQMSKLDNLSLESCHSFQRDAQVPIVYHNDTLVSQLISVLKPVLQQAL